MLLIFKLLVVILCCSSYVDGKSRPFFRDDYTYISELKSFYKLHKEPTNWFDAKKRCALEGALLWIPENKQEVKAVLEFKKKTDTMDTVYIGLNDLLTEETFATIDGRSIEEVYHVWDNGEPNGKESEDCGTMRDNMKLNDVSCKTTRLSFLCKKTLASLNALCDLPSTTYQCFNEVGKCYKLHRCQKTWTEAYETCKTEQSYLAVINSQHEANVLAKLYADTPKENDEWPIDSNSFHIGFHNPNGMDWVNVKGVRLERSGYNKWEQSQPDNNTLVNNCGGMDTNAELHDVGCEQVSFFICEHDIEVMKSKERFGTSFSLDAKFTLNVDARYMPVS